MDDREKWMGIVDQFHKNINAFVICPYCKNDYLTVRDVAFDSEDINSGGERYIQCPICGKYEIVLYGTPPLNWYSKKHNIEE